MKNNMEKLYKLKTDLPTFKAGDLFYLDRNGSLRHKETDIVAYHYSTLDKFPDALEKFWEPVEEELKRWRADYGEEYYIVDSDATIFSPGENGSTSDNNRYRCGNYFKTREEAQAVADYLKALAVVRDDAKGFVPDWKDGGQSKWHVAYSGASDRFLTVYTITAVEAGVFGLPYFKSKKDAQESINKHKKEWEIIFGIKDEEEE